MNSKITAIIDYALGRKVNLDSEKYFLILTCLSASVFFFLLSIFHLIEGLKSGLIFIALAASVILFILYYFLRYKSCLLIPKIILTIPSIILLDITWYMKFLSSGPVLLVLLVFGALIIWVWHGRGLVLMSIFYFLNIAALFFIEYNADLSLHEYPDQNARIVDIYLSFFFYSLLMIFLLFMVKKEYIQQREIAIKSDQLKSAFLANMSHEIRTPLNSIVGFSQLIQKEKDSDKNLVYMDIINQSSDNLLSLIDDIIDLSKIEVGETNLSYSTFSIEEMFKLLKDVNQVELQNRNKSQVELNYSLPDGNFIVYSAANRIRQILSNLLINSIKFTSSGKITFSCQQNENELLFTVKDTGTGIKKENQEKIFDRFTKFSPDESDVEGTGIGLSIVKKLVDLLQGRIWFESAAYKGTSFFFAIPLIKSDPSNIEKAEIKPDMKPFIKKGKKKILLVEDDQGSMLLLKEILKPLNHDIFQVEDGLQAVRFMESNPDTSVILMDLALPKLDGYEATSSIKSLNPDTFIIAQTGNAMLGDKDKAIGSGCDYYISKPINPIELVNIISSLN